MLSKEIIKQKKKAKAKKEINFFEGIGGPTGEFSMAELDKSRELAKGKEETESGLGLGAGGLGGMLQGGGLEKMLGLDKIAEQLKTVDKSQLKKASEECKILRSF